RRRGGIAKILHLHRDQDFFAFSQWFEAPPGMRHFHIGAFDSSSRLVLSPTKVTQSARNEDEQASENSDPIGPTAQLFITLALLALALYFPLFPGVDVDDYGELTRKSLTIWSLLYVVAFFGLFAFGGNWWNRLLNSISGLVAFVV